MEDQIYWEKLFRLLDKDVNTYEHSLRVGKLCELMARHFHLDGKQTRQLFQGGVLHDIGKVLIPDGILKKDSGLDTEEWKIMQQHPSLGARMMLAHGNIDQEMVDIIQYHHERWNGNGYPKGLSGDSIPVLARICAIIDCFDCMVSDRPYRRGLSFSEAKEELLLHRGTQFDPYYVDLFLNGSHFFEGVYSLKKT